MSSISDEYCRGCEGGDVELVASMVMVRLPYVPDAEALKGDFCADCMTVGGWRCLECGKPLTTKSDLVYDPSGITHGDVTTKMITVKITAPDGSVRYHDFCSEEHLRGYFERESIPDSAWEVVEL